MRSIVFTYARMSPPTIGHERLVRCLVETSKIHQADHCIYLSQTHKPPTDPLDWGFKLRICRTAFPGVKISNDSRIKTPFQALESFKGKYDKVFLVVGSDRVEEFSTRMTPYATQWGLDFEVVSAGNRNPLLEGVEGISASKLREFAINGEDEKFLSNLPKTINNRIGELILWNTKKGLKKS